MLVQGLLQVITTLGGLFAAALLLRFMLQLLRAPARNQMSRFLAALTDFAVRPARRVIPGLWGLDLATLVLAWLVEVVLIWLVLVVRGHEIGPAVGVTVIALCALAAMQLFKLAVYIIIAALVLQGILSWVVPYSPLAPLLASVTRPVLRPFQKLIPLVANVDLSPLAALLVGLLVVLPLLEWGESVLGRLIGWH